MGIIVLTGFTGREKRLRVNQWGLEKACILERLGDWATGVGKSGFCTFNIEVHEIMGIHL